MMPVQVPTAETAIDEARDVWIRGYREATEAGREIPVKEIPRELGAVARYSCEATDDMGRRARSRSFLVNVDIRALEANRLAREAAEAQKRRQARRPSRKKGHSK